MTHTLDQLLRFVEENDIKFIRLAFCDMFGVQKNIAIMSSQLRHAAEQGVSFDASAIPGFANVAESDLFLQPDLDTFALLPWRPSEGCVGRLFCDVRYTAGRPFEGVGRALLRRTEQAAAKEGYHFLVGPECEFYLFETDEHGQPTRIPFDQGGYFDLAPIDRGENVRRSICLTLEEMGIQPERSHHEQGPGQNEIDFRCASPLQAADDLMTVHMVVKAIAGQHGLFASGPDFDITFGLAHTIEKSAEIYVKVLSMGGGLIRQTITDDDLRAIARDFGVTLNENFLD